MRTLLTSSSPSLPRRSPRRRRNLRRLPTAIVAGHRHRRRHRSAAPQGAGEGHQQCARTDADRDAPTAMDGSRSRCRRASTIVSASKARLSRHGDGRATAGRGGRHTDSRRRRPEDRHGRRAVAARRRDQRHDHRRVRRSRVRDGRARDALRLSERAAVRDDVRPAGRDGRSRRLPSRGSAAWRVHRQRRAARRRLAAGEAERRMCARQKASVAAAKAAGNDWPIGLRRDALRGAVRAGRLERVRARRTIRAACSRRGARRCASRLARRSRESTSGCRSCRRRTSPARSAGPKARCRRARACS